MVLLGQPCCALSPLGATLATATLGVAGRPGGDQAKNFMTLSTVL